MSSSAEAELTGLLAAWNAGDEGAFDAASGLLYRELRTLARSHLRRESLRPLETTELVHEAFLRLTAQSRLEWRNRHHFFGIASQMMRRILVDHARRSRYQKRGGGEQPLRLDDLPPLAEEASREVLAVDEALGALARVDATKAKLVELRFFGGFEMQEIADALDVSLSTVNREWRLARAWLYRELAAPDSASG